MPVQQKKGWIQHENVQEYRKFLWDLLFVAWFDLSCVVSFVASCVASFMESFEASSLACRDLSFVACFDLSCVASFVVSCVGSFVAWFVAFFVASFVAWQDLSLVTCYYLTNFDRVWVPRDWVPGVTSSRSDPHLCRDRSTSRFSDPNGTESACREAVQVLQPCTLQYKFYLHDYLPHPTHLYIPGTCSTGTSQCGSGRGRNHSVLV